MAALSSHPGHLIAAIFKFSPEQHKAQSKSLADEYSRLLQVLRGGGLVAAGKRTSSPGEIVVLISCIDETKSAEIISRELFPLNTIASQKSLHNTSPPIRARALLTYVTSPTESKGLGISPGPDWPHLQTIIVPRPEEYKTAWIDKLKTHLPSVGYSDAEIQFMAEHYGESAAYYFAFLTEYTKSLIIPSAVGVGLWFQSVSFVRPWFSLFILVWAVVFIERWRAKHARLAAKWKSSSIDIPSQPASRRDSWWKSEAKTALSIPLLLLSMCFVGMNMSIAFILEAFVARLYNGPYKFLAPLTPTVYNVLTTPPFVAVYSGIAGKLTAWEKHTSQSSHDASLVIKVAPITGMVPFFALILSAGLYVPFGNDLMHYFHLSYFADPVTVVDGDFTVFSSQSANISLPETTPHTRLGEQLFSFTFVLQLAPLIAELLIPIALRWGTQKWKDSKKGSQASKAVSGKNGDEQTGLVDRVAYEASLPDHRFFDDYLTLTMQFGYCVMWSTAWPLTPAMALLLAVIRLRTDAFKILTNYKYTVPPRDASDSAKVWISTMSFIVWLGAIINAALILILDPFLHTPTELRPRVNVPALVHQVQTQSSSFYDFTPLMSQATAEHVAIEAFAPAANLVIILLASYAILVFKRYVQHVFSTLGKESRNVADVGEVEDEVRTTEGKSLGGRTVSTSGDDTNVLSQAFWDEDEGEAEIWKKDH